MIATGRKYLKGFRKALPAVVFNILPDKLFVKLLFFYSYGRFPDLREPKTFDEKIQWYKLFYRKPEMTKLADKLSVREYVGEKGYGHILNDLYFAKDKLEPNDFENLPDKYVIKATHGCNFNIIVESSDDIDIEETTATVNKWLKRNYYSHGREWAYKDIRPKVICEKYLQNAAYNDLIDYKFYCYSGKPEVVFACAGRYSEEGVKYNAYDMDWNRINVIKGKPGVEIDFKAPENFEEMKEAAGILSGDYPFIRVDLYSINGKTIFGELTFYPDSGIIPFTPDKYNYIFGDLFKLPERL